MSDRTETLKVFGRSLVVGGVAAAISKTTCAPLERLKIILQVNSKSANAEQFSGMLACTKYLWNNQPAGRSPLLKLFTYYRGNYSNVIRYFPTQALNFTFKGFFKRMFFDKKKRYNTWGHMWRYMMAGGCAGALCLFFVYPMDFARTRLTSDTASGRAYKGLSDCIISTMKNEGGPLAVYKGFMPSVVGIFPYRAGYFGFYDTAKKLVFKNHPENYNFAYQWIVSQTTTVFAQFIVYPLDTVRRRMQISGDKKMAQGARVYKGSVDCFKSILKEEGLVAMYQGFKANAFRATGSALCLVAYDAIGRFLFLDKDYGT